VEGPDGLTAAMAKAETEKGEKLQVVVVNVVELVLEEEEDCEEDREGGEHGLHKGLVGRLLELRQYEHDAFTNVLSALFFFLVLINRELLNFYIWTLCLGSTDQTLANIRLGHFLDSLVDTEIRENLGG
jgi:hypothetical protein